jgi:hypothetical protein
MLSSGIRSGAWDYLKWKHVTPIYNEKDNVIAAKILVYPGDKEKYFSFISVEAYLSLQNWMDYRQSFGEKMIEIEKLMMDYLIWFEICPIAIGLRRTTKVEWNNEKDDKGIIKIIAKLALLLSHLRGHVIVYENSEHPDYLPVENNDNSYNSGFSHRLPIIENPSRAAQQLYNLARGHALSYGRNYITKDDIQIVIKVVLSTSLIERVLILDLLIAFNGTLTTSQIIASLRIAPNTAKRTMTEFKGLELVEMERVDPNNPKSEYKITLNPKFKWFLTDEFKKLRKNSNQLITRMK